MSLIIDLIALAIISLCIFIGYKQGLIKVAIKLLSFIIALVIALAIYKPVANLVIENTEIDNNIQNTIIAKILPENGNEDDKIEVSDGIYGLVVESSQSTVKNIANTFAVKIIELACFFVIFIVVKILLRFVTVLADLIAKLPIIKQLNKLGGTIYGILHGFIVVFAILAVISLATPLIGESFINTINQSILCNVLYKNNLLLMIIL